MGGNVVLYGGKWRAKESAETEKTRELEVVSNSVMYRRLGVIVLLIFCLHYMGASISTAEHRATRPQH